MLHFDDLLSSVVAVEGLPPGSVLLLNPGYKTVQVNQGEPPMLQQVLDLEKTAQNSILLTNVSTPKNG